MRDQAGTRTLDDWYSDAIAILERSRHRVAHTQGLSAKEGEALRLSKQVVWLDDPEAR